MSAPITIRPAEPEDVGFVLTTFCKSYKEASAYADGTPAQLLGALLRNVLGAWSTIVAVDPDDPTVVLGWLVFRGPTTVAWCYVQSGLRRRGVARALLAQAGVRKGSITTPFAATRLTWLRSKWDVRFRPYLALGAS